MTTLLLAISAAYAVVVAAFALGAARLRRSSAREGHLDLEDLPRAVVVVAARDEEARLPRCLDALIAQDYPAERLLVVVVDDHSVDGTPAILARYRRRIEVSLAGGVEAGDALEMHPAGTPGGDSLPAPHAGPAVIAIKTPEGGTLRGKAAALQAGIEAAAPFAPELVLFTDADCAPPRGWARAMASRLSEPGIGLVCGRTEVEAEGDSMLDKAEALDWTYLLTAAAVLTENVLPGTGMGNNMGVRLEAYRAIGGYHGVRFSVTEDHALIHAVASRTNWRMRFPLDPALAVRTLPLGTLREVYAQRRRWARGGVLAGPALFVLYALVYFGTLAPAAGAGLALAGAFPWVAVAAMLGLKLGVDYAFFRGALAPDRRQLLRALLHVEGLLLLYFTTVPFTLLAAPRIHWKGRTH